ncbi:MAG: hypothetical protein QM728_12775 [Gordonia sp. (in: high G+C Gram-positive bacteria)]|uniref:hypothetical protein n=1 Tax=Gordonia sp. (in: high G+C Gram-positive bacteria) TaxID=84139 RepID=UPI0039E23595
MAKRAKRPAAQPVRVAPIKRRPRGGRVAAERSEPVVSTPSKATAPAEAAVSSDRDSAVSSPRKSKPETAKASSKTESFVTVDRVDPRVAALGFAAAAVATLLLVASVLFGYFGYRLHERNDLRHQYDDFAQQVTVNLTSLNKTNVDTIRKTLLDKTSGTAYENLNLVTQQIIGMIEQHDIQTQGQVLSRAVTRAEPDYGQVLMVLGWTQRLSNKKEDVERQVFRWKVDMRRINGDLKVTKLDWVY